MKIRTLYILLLFACTALAFPAALPAEVVLDGSMGTSGSLAGPNYNITPNLGRLSGTNLFHSFSRFSLTSAESATFSGPPQVLNVIGRVTGGEVSNIDGLLRVSIPNANLYLLNPAGILFGPNARLDLGGSFYAATTDYLGFEDATRFYSLPVEGELLSSAPPNAFGFLDGPLGAISLIGPGEILPNEWDGQPPGLEVLQGKTLALVSGEISLSSGAYMMTAENPQDTGDNPPPDGEAPPDGGLPPKAGEEAPADEGNGTIRRLGSLTAPGGAIILAAAGGPGEVVMTEQGPDVSSFAALGPIDITENSQVSAGGPLSGDIFIRAGRFYLENSIVLNNNLGPQEGGLVDIRAQEALLAGGATVDASTEGSGKGGTLVFEVEKELVLQGTNGLADFTSLNINTMGPGETGGDAGEMRIRAGSLSLLDGAILTGYSLGRGKAGSIFIETPGDIRIRGIGSLISLGTQGRQAWAGDAGDLSITARNLAIIDGGAVKGRTSGAGDSGTITINVDSLQMFSSGTGDAAGGIEIGNTIESTGGGGGILFINARLISLEDGAVITASAEGPGHGGDIHIKASESLSLTGVSTSGFASNIQATSRSKYIDDPVGTNPDAGPGQGPPMASSVAGPGGNIYVTAGSILLTDGANISANTTALADGQKSGDAGEVHVIADIIRAVGVNPYGENFDGLGSGFYAKSLGMKDNAGKAGTIHINAGELSLENGGVILTDTYAWGDGGDIRIKCSGDVTISGSGAAGVIFPPAESQITFNMAVDPGHHHPGDSGVFASSTGGDPESGDGGSIVMHANNLYLCNGGRIDAQSGGGGSAGSIGITAEDSIYLENGAVISSSARLAGGGRIDIAAKNRLELTNSSIATDVHEGREDGGDIRIDPIFVILNKSTISANAEAGNGGNIFISAKHFIASADSAVTASSKTGIDGNVVINSPDVNLAASLVNLPAQYLDASQWARTPCEQRRAGDISRFEIVKPEGVAAPLDDLREAMPRAGDPSLDQAISKGDFAAAALILEKEPESLHRAVFLSYALQSLGRLREAQKVLEQAQAGFENSRDLREQALYLSRQGDLALLTGQKKAAIGNIKQGLALAEKSGDPEVLACLLNNLGNLRAVNGDFPGAVSAFTKSAEAASGLSLAPLARSNLARLYLVNGDEKAFARESAEAARELAGLGPGPEKARGTIALAYLADQAGKVSESLRSALEKGLRAAAETEENAGSPRIRSQAYGCLGLLYEQAGETDQARKAFQQAMHAARLGDSPDLLFSWLRRRGKLTSDTAESILAYKQAVATLAPIRMAYLASFRDGSRVFEEKIRPVYLELAALLMENPELVAEARDIVELLKRAELMNYFQDECLTTASWRPFQASEIPEGTAILYPISFPEHLSLLLMTRDALEAVQVPVDKEELAKTARNFRKRLESMDESLPREAGTLYDWILRPVAGSLAEARVDTLVVAPDGALRTVPFGALHDGKRYLVESMAVATVFAAGITNLEAGRGAKPQALLNGLTVEKEGFAPLSHVSEELAAIHRMVPGTVLLNESFTVPKLQEEINRKDYGILHMATHALFGGRADNSFLVTYDGRLYMDELERLVGLASYRDRALELLMLSACETASGDERAAFGLAGAALSAGAKSTVATLWKTDDQAASLLVEDFYQGYIGSGMGKAKALQAAQKKLLAGKRYSNPYFWAAFTLIGNWE